MRLSALLAAALLLASCQQPVVYVPGPPVEDPAPPPPVKPPPVDPPPAQPPPAGVADLLARVELGASLAQVTAAIGSPPERVPAGAGPDVARWYVTEGEARFLVFVVFEGGRATRKGSSRVEEVR